ncbi:MAG: type II CAAX prenyl endopeptidase Rce1 family protein, partial [Myxococcales bacterium]
MSEPHDPASVVEPLTPAERVALASLPAGGMFVLFLLGQLLLGPILQLANVGFGLIFAGVFALAVPPILYLRASNLSPWDFLRLHPPRLGQLGLGFAIGAANFLVAGVLQFGMRRLVPDEWARRFDATHIFRDASGSDLALIVVAVAVSAPVCEEIAFRGYLQNAFRGRRGDLAAVVLTATLFSALHLDPIGFFARVELGVLFGLLALWSGSLLPAIAAHMANNFIAASLFMLAVSREGGAAAEGGEPKVLVALGGAALSALITLFLLSKFRASAEPERLQAPLLVAVEPEGDHLARLARIRRPLLGVAASALA